MRRKHTIGKRILTGVLSLAMVLTSVNLPSFASTVQAAENFGTITEVKALDGSIQNQTIQQGASEDDIIFPETLNVTVSNTVIEDTNTVTEDKSVSITWKLDDEKSSTGIFSSEEEGATYTYDAVLEDSYTLDNGVELPEIIVSITANIETMAFRQSQTIDGVKVTALADEGVFPVDATLSVSKVDTAIEEKVTDNVDEVRSEETNVVKSYTFDIKVLDTDGNEIQPDTTKGQVKVSFSLVEAANDNLDAEVYHISDEILNDESKSAEKLDSNVETVDGVDAVVAETTGFSYYTVEFTYGDLQYVMQGDTSIPLADILAYVNLTGTVTNAVSSNPELFDVLQDENGVWTVTAKQAFFSEEILNVGIDGISYNIKVTDAVELNAYHIYAVDMTTDEITLETEADAAGYQWQVCDTKTGTYTAIENATSNTYTFTPQNGKWYRCEITGQRRKKYTDAIKAIKVGSDSISFLRATSGKWYVSNDVMAYYVNKTNREFDIVGKYTKNDTTYWMNTSYDKYWRFGAEQSTAPSATKDYKDTGDFKSVHLSFQASDPRVVLVEAELAEGYHSFAMGTDTMLGNSSVTQYADNASLKAIMKDDELTQVQMVGALNLEEALDTDPALVFKPITKPSSFWIGAYSQCARGSAYTYNLETSRSGYVLGEVAGQNVVTEVQGIDSSMAASWTNCTEVSFQFSIGTVEQTGAITKVKATSSEIEVSEAEEDRYYALYDSDNHKVAGWTKEKDENGNIVFPELESNKAYVVKSISDSDYQTYLNNRSSESEEPDPSKIRVEKTIQTMIDPLHQDSDDPDDPAMPPVITPKATSIIITGLNTEYTYALLDEAGVTVKSYTAPDTSGNITFTGLSSETTYYLIAQTGTNTTSDRVKIVTTPYHQHVWNYVGAGNTIEAYCISEDEYANSCNYHGREKSILLTISAKDAVYCTDGYTMSQIKVNNDISDITKATVSDIKIYKDEALTKKVEPKNVGTYYASVSIGDVKAYTAFHITKAEQADIVVDTADYTFHTTVSEPSKISGKVMEDAQPTYYYNTSDSNENGKPWSELTPTTLDVGNYYVYAVYPATDNYKKFITRTSEFKVTPKTILDTDVTATGGTYTYSGQEYGITVNVDKAAVLNATITYGESANPCTLTESPKYKNASDTAYTVYYEISAKNYTTYKGNAAITINKADATVTPDENQSKIYGDAEPNYTFDASGLVNGEKKDVLGVTLQRAKGEDVGEYAFSIKKVTTTNYNVTLANDSPKFKITPKPVTLTWGTDALTYTGTEQKMEANVSNKVGADTFTLTYENEGSNVNKATAVGDYKAIVTELGNSNYTLTGATGVSQTWKISYLSAEATISGTKKVQDGDWYTSTVVVQPKNTGYQISTDGTNWQNQIPVKSDGEHTVTFYLKQTSTGFITDQMQERFKIDTTAPTGTITVKNNDVTRFFNTITVGFFFKKIVDVTITAEDRKADGVDAVSDIAKVEYQKTARGASYTDDGWVTGKNFSVVANEKFDVFVRITDKAGNETIIDSKGNVVYQDAVATDEFTFTKTSTEDHTTMIDVGGNTVKSVSIQKDTVSAGIARVMDAQAVPADAYDVADNKIVLMKDYLNSLGAGDYIITVNYNPYGETFTDGQDAAPSTITVHVVKATGTVKITNDISKTYDKTAVSIPTFTKNSTKDAVIEYKIQGADDSTYTVTAPTTVGKYTVRVFVDADENYTKASDEKNFTISKEKAEITVADDNKSYVKSYGEDAFTLEGITKTGESEVTFTSNNTDVVTVDKNGIVTIKGTGKTTITLAMAASDNYEETTATVDVTVNPKSITVQADDKTVTYGDKEVTLTYTATGLVGNDELTDLTVSKADGNNVGTYDITVEQETDANSNYAITFEKGSYVIEPKSIVGATVTLGDKVTANGTEQTQKVTSVVIGEISATYTVADNTAKAAGKYTMKITGNGNFKDTIEKTFVVVDPENPADQGNVKVDVSIDPKAPETEMTTPKKELMEMVMTADEAAAVADGAELKIWLEVNDATDSIKPESKKQIEKGTDGYKIGQYIDISLFKKLSTKKEATQITGTNKAVKIAIAIPDNLVNKNSKITRTYAIVRNHDGKVEILGTSYDGKNQTLTFETDKFSDYAIIYKDKEKPDPAKPVDNKKTTAPKTGDNFEPKLWLFLMGVSLAGMSGATRLRKKDEKQNS